MKKSIFAFILNITFLLSLKAQVYPFYEDFESFGNNFPQISTGGYSSDMFAYPRGVNGSKCAQAQMTQFNAKDTLLTPLIGPLTATSQLSFYFRVVEYIGSVAVGHTLSNTASIQVQAGTSGIFQTLLTITAANQNSGTTFKKVTLPAGTFAGISGNLKFRALHPNNTGDWFLHIDSIVVRDTVAGTCTIVLGGAATNVTCNRFNNGSVDITVNGCAAPYGFLWSNNATKQNLSNLAPGSYTVTVTSGSVTASNSYTVSQPNSLNVSAFAIDETYFGACDGEVSANVNGGTPPFSYNPLINLCVGSYTLTVIDDNGCTASSQATVSGPSELEVTTSATPSSGNDGTATVTAFGGTAPYDFTWNDANNQTTATATNLPAGDYEVTVTDDNGCEVVTTVIVEVAVGIANNIDNVNIEIMPNPASNFIKIKSAEIFSLNIINTVGQVIEKYEVAPAVISVQDFPKGYYLMLFKNQQGIYKKIVTIQ